MASEYLNNHYPDANGFSPRNLRRMRDFYRTYENHLDLMSCAIQLGWLQNVVIMEEEVTMEMREWYMKAVEQFKWSKLELTENIKNEGHKEIVLDIGLNLSENRTNEVNEVRMFCDQHGCKH